MRRVTRSALLLLPHMQLEPALLLQRGCRDQHQASPPCPCCSSRSGTEDNEAKQSHLCSEMHSSLPMWCAFGSCGATLGTAQEQQAGALPYDRSAAAHAGGLGHGADWLSLCQVTAQPQEPCLQLPDPFPGFPLIPSTLALPWKARVVSSCPSSTATASPASGQRPAGEPTERAPFSALSLHLPKSRGPRANTCQQSGVSGTFSSRRPAGLFLGG